ncbi:hypothetical protein A6A06_23485 [Streptomyces sp. CB02923]|uniref:hypothetical protein n=1 Tax=Streptomyces sp. CB02923 TaxID=1718985 RepID=UPI00093BB0DC|nr:hypothetical protein [Streptomyces sp. CB02923]OKH99986.1 hypothetical protein A6A06_23485 [Streptomyces sp. CB02923]
MDREHRIEDTDFTRWLLTTARSAGWDVDGDQEARNTLRLSAALIRTSGKAVVDMARLADALKVPVADIEQAAAKERSANEAAARLLDRPDMAELDTRLDGVAWPVAPVQDFEAKQAVKRAAAEAEHAQCVRCVWDRQKGREEDPGGHRPYPWNETANVCTGCGVAKPWEEFHRDARMPMKRVRRCRTCRHRTQMGLEPRADAKPPTRRRSSDMTSGHQEVRLPTGEEGTDGHLDT